MYIALTQVILDLTLLPIFFLVITYTISDKKKDLKPLFSWIIALEFFKAILYVIAGPFWQVLLSAVIILWALYSKHQIENSQ